MDENNQNTQKNKKYNALTTFVSGQDQRKLKDKNRQNRGTQQLVDDSVEGFSYAQLLAKYKARCQEVAKARADRGPMYNLSLFSECT